MRVSTLILYSFAKRYRFALGFNLAEGAAPKKQQEMKKLYSILFLLFLTLASLKATHIVGGELSYRCLGNELYEINLRVFRDCDTGVPWFDDPASIGVFDDNDQLLFDLRTRPVSNDTLSPELEDPCLVVPPNVCIHTTYYRDTVQLPFRAGGYQLVYQRCCRNQDIVNIVSPLNTGATYYCLITEAALQGCNSSPEFRDWPPVYICANKPLRFDHSATDADGDSLVYRLSTPLDGAAPLNPMPQPPYNPPYTPVNWLGAFSESNMMGGQDSLRIDPQTGLLQGTPTILGVFVVGVAVEEYRNGQLISTMRRDFQYAVGICGELVSSAFFAPEIQCDNDLLVQFQNNSQSLGSGFQWYFGDSLQSSSSLDDPVFIYPDTGRYTITLIADPGSSCADTAQQEIYLQYESIALDADFVLGPCSDSIELQVTDLSIDSISAIGQWLWDFGHGDTAQTPFASTVYTQSGSYPISLNLRALNGCERSLYDTIDIQLAQLNMADSIPLCPGQDSIQLNQGGDPNLQYQWGPAAAFSDPQAASPWVRPTSSSSYQVTVTANSSTGDSCQLIKTVWVIVPPPIQLLAVSDTASCADTLSLGVQTSVPADISWSYSPNFLPLQSSSNPAQIIMPPPGPAFPVYIRAKDAWGCTLIDSIILQGQDIPLQAAFSYNMANCGPPMQIQFTDETVDSSQGPIVAWDWDFGNGQQSNQQHPAVNYTQSGSYVVQLRVTSEQGCQGLVQDTLQQIQLPILFGPDTVGICQGESSVVLNAGGDSSLSYSWSPAGSLSDASSPSPTASPSGPTTYRITITAANGCTAVDSVFLGFPPAVTVSLEDQQYCGNSVSLNAESPTAVDYIWSSDPSFFTVLGQGNPISFSPPSSPWAYYVQATDVYGCQATDFAVVQQINSSPNTEFTWSSLGCNFPLQLQFTDLSDTSLAEIVSWQWTTSNGQQSNQQHPLFSFNRSGPVLVRLDITLANGCTGSYSEILDLNIPALAGANSRTLCFNEDSLALNPGGDATGLSYSWSPAIGLSNPNSAHPIAQPPSFPYSYQVQITAYNSWDTCSRTETVTVSQGAPLSISVVEDTSFCISQFTLSANASYNVSDIDWSLTPDFSSILVANSSSFTLNYGSNPSNLTFYVRGQDQFGCAVYDTAQLHYQTAPIQVQAQASYPPCPTDSVAVQFQDLTADTSQASIVNWNWRFGPGQTASGANPSFVYGPADSTHIFQLELTLENGCGGIFVDSLAVRALGLALPDSLGLCGDTSGFVLQPNANQQLNYQWSPALGLSDPNSPSPYYTPAGNQLYTVLISDPSTGCQYTDSLYIFADSLQLNLIEDQVICGNNVSLWAYSNDSSSRYDWALDPNFQLILGQANPLNINLHQGRRFYLRAQNSLGCKAIDSVDLAVLNRPLDLQWELLLDSCGENLSLSYSAQSADSNLLSPLVWQWDFGNGQLSSLDSGQISYDSSGTYLLQVRLQGPGNCAAEDQAPIHFSLAGQSALDSIWVCSGEVAELYPLADTAWSYSWSPAAALDDPSLPNPRTFLAGNYQFLAQSPILLAGQTIGTCVDSGQVVLGHRPLPDLQLLGEEDLCTPAFSLIARSDLGQQFSWSSLADFSLILGQDSLYQDSLFADSLLLYAQTLTEFGCPQMDSFWLYQRGIRAQLVDTALACPNAPAQLEVLDLQQQSLSYYWSPDSLLLAGQGTARVQMSPSQDQQYQVLLTNAYGCSDSLSAWVRVSGQLQSIQLQANPDTVFLGQESQLTVLGQGDYSYQWQPQPSLSADDIADPLAQPDSAQLYIVSAQDAMGCQTTDSIWVYTKSYICGPPYVFLPNSFSPNGDGHNDVFRLRSNVVQEFELLVFDRWGEQVFRSQSQDEAWDGRFRNQELPPDVYGYYLRYRCLGQSEEDPWQVLKGNLSLIR